MKIKKSLMLQRKLINAFVNLISTICAFTSIAFLFWITADVFLKGLEGLSTFGLDIFLVDTQPSGSETNGLRNAILGHLTIISGASFLGIPIGILAGTFLSEYGQNSKLTGFIRDISDVLISVPSIIIGSFIYTVVVLPLGNFSGLAGIFALAIMMLPIIIRTTDDMLSLVPKDLREAAIALGAPKYKMILQVVYRSAKTGILTGVILAIARIAGEAAPLLFTSLNSMYLPQGLFEPMPSLTVTIYEFANSGLDDWISLGWTGAFILTMFILILNITSRIILLKRRK